MRIFSFPYLTNKVKVIILICQLIALGCLLMAHRVSVGLFFMPITKNIKKNFHELYADNKKKGKARGANGKPRSRAQIIAIALSKSKKKK